MLAVAGIVDRCRVEPPFALGFVSRPGCHVRAGPRPSAKSISCKREHDGCLRIMLSGKTDASDLVVYALDDCGT